MALALVLVLKSRALLLHRLEDLDQLPLPLRETVLLTTISLDLTLVLAIMLTVPMGQALMTMG